MAANTTTSDEPPSQPRKASWKRWALASAFVLAFALALLFLKAPRREPVSVTFVGYSRDHDQRTVIFKGTNGLSKTITYYACIVWFPSYANGSGGFVSDGHYRTGGEVGPGGTFTFNLDAPPKEPDWRVMWDFYEQHHVETRSEKLRRWSYSFATKHRMITMARWVGSPSRPHYIPSTDLKD